MSSFFSSFTNFTSPRMPTELQTLIWKHHIDSYPPRTIELRKNTSQPGNQSPAYELHPNISLYNFNMTSHAPIPAVLHVSPQSRTLARQSRWKLSFGMIAPVKCLPGGEWEMHRMPKVWFDFTHDRLLFLERNGGIRINHGMRDLHHLLLEEDRYAVRNIAVYFLDHHVEVFSLGHDVEREANEGFRSALELKSAFPFVRHAVAVFGFGRVDGPLGVGEVVVPVSGSILEGWRMTTKERSMLRALEEMGCMGSSICALESRDSEKWYWLGE